MILQTDINNGCLVATVLVKEANLTVSDQFKAELFAAINTGNPAIVVDFKTVIYVDSSFLGALVSGLKHAIGNKADVVIAGLNKDIFSLFQLIRLDKAFKIYKSAEEAIQSKVS